MKEKIRHCPLCKSNGTCKSFSHTSIFKATKYYYVKCINCACIYINPSPNSLALKYMYTKNDYHDCFYNKEDESSEYSKSASLLKLYMHDGDKVLDYGCGIGGFLEALEQENLIPYGVEYDKKTAIAISDKTLFNIMSVEYFMNARFDYFFDGIHFGDVLEHVSDPVETLNEVLCKLKSGGVLYVEGPLETNASFVYWAAHIFSLIKCILFPNLVVNDPPYHLFLCNEKQQRDFFNNVDASLKLKYWRVYETGWPYLSGGIVKKMIAYTAIFLGGKKLFGMTFGNRFQAVFIKGSD